MSLRRVGDSFLVSGRSGADGRFALAALPGGFELSASVIESGQFQMMQLIAVATPPMLPFPTVDASAVESAWKGVIVFDPAASFLNAPFITMRSASGNRRIWKNPVT